MPFFKHFTFFSGYQLLYASRVVRAAEQINPDLTDYVTKSKTIGDLFLHGPRVGVVFTY